MKRSFQLTILVKASTFDLKLTFFRIRTNKENKTLHGPGQLKHTIV